jgi:hypothetical protein
MPKEETVKLPSKVWNRIDTECTETLNVKPLPVLVPHDPIKYQIKKQLEVIKPK